MAWYLWAFIAGIFGAYCMDFVGGQAAKRGISSGVDISHVGRWFLGMFQGRFVHADIATSAPVDNEVRAGLYFHFIVGGGAVGLGYPLLFLLLPWTNHLLMGLVFGVATLPLLWFVMLPSFGWGWFGSNGPENTKMIEAGLLTHLAYGLGVGVFMQAIALVGLL